MSIRRPIDLEKRGDTFFARFQAYAGPCEIHLCAVSHNEARTLAGLAAEEAWRIEQKYSRYRDDSWLAELHSARGEWVDADRETLTLLEFADAVYHASAGAFDLTSGVLRRVWSFSPGSQPPSQQTVDEVRELIGWPRVERDTTGGRVRLPAGMELDLGGIGKEYAVDSTVRLLLSHTQQPLLVNYGGDLLATSPRPDGTPWRVGVDNPGDTGQAAGALELQQGALATSGDARRFLEHAGKRYGHILDARTGFPPSDAPRSVTVLADTCSEAGVLSTLAILRGAGAEEFLREAGKRFWVMR